MTRNWRILNVDDQWPGLRQILDEQLLRPAGTLEAHGINYGGEGAKPYRSRKVMHEQYHPFKEGVLRNEYCLGWALGSLSHAWEMLDLLEVHRLTLDVCFFDIKLDVPQEKAFLVDKQGDEDLTAPRRAFRKYIEQTQGLHLQGEFHEDAGKAVLQSDSEFILPRGGIYLAARVLNSQRRFGNPEIYFYTQDDSVPKDMFPFLYAYNIRIWDKDRMSKHDVVKAVFRQRQELYLRNGVVSQSMAVNCLCALRNAQSDNERIVAALNMPLQDAEDGWTCATFFAPQLWFPGSEEDAIGDFDWNAWVLDYGRRIEEIAELLRAVDFGEAATRFFFDGVVHVLGHGAASETCETTLKPSGRKVSRKNLADAPDLWSPIPAWKSMPSELGRLLRLETLEELWGRFSGEHHFERAAWRSLYEAHCMRTQDIKDALKRKWGVECSIEEDIQAASFCCGHEGAALFSVLERLFGESDEHKNSVVRADLRGLRYRPQEVRLRLRFGFEAPWDLSKCASIARMPGTFGDCLREFSAWFGYRLAQEDRIFDLKDGSVSRVVSLADCGACAFELDFYGVVP